MDFVGNYQINIKFDDMVVPILPQMIEQFTITEDIDRIVPTFKLSVKDATGVLGEIIPFDKSVNNMSIEIGRGTNPDMFNEFNFLVKRRNVTSDKIYEVEGILNVEGLLSPYRKRALTGNVKTNLESIAIDELGVDITNVGASLNYEKTILQPNWNNVKLFNYLKNNLLGADFCFITNILGFQTFVCKSLDEILLSPVHYKFIIASKDYEDFYPVVDWKVYDDSSLLSDFSGKSQDYRYFDYKTGEYITTNLDIDGCPALAENFLIEADNDVKFLFPMLGRSNDFTSNFEGKIKTSFYKRVTNFIGMWISTWGLQNISAGDIIQVTFGESLKTGNLFLYQHSGSWMVKRVVHVISTSFMTNLFLVRCGVDTDIETTLLETTNQKK